MLIGSFSTHPKKLGDIMEEENKEEIKLEDLQFPKDFIFQQTSNGFKVNTAKGGEFFPNKFALVFGYLISTLFLLCFFILAPYFCFFQKNIVVAGALLLFSFFIIIPYMFAVNITNIKTEYTFSSNGINVTSKKDSLFIPKEKIKNMYIKQLKGITSRNETYYYYPIYIEFKEPLYIPYTKKNKEIVNLFLDNRTEKNISLFILQELDKTFDLNYLDNCFEEMNKKENNISINEIQLPKNLNYQQINNGIEITSGGGTFFSAKDNIFFIRAAFFISFLTFAVFFASFISNGLLVIGLFFVFVFFLSLLGFIKKITMPKADYIFSPDGINIIRKDISPFTIQKSFSIPKDNIDNIYVENAPEMSGTDTINNETITYYKIYLNLKEPIYTKSSLADKFDLEKIFINNMSNIPIKDSNKIEKAQLLDKFADKKVARFFVQEMKKALQIDY